MRFNKSTLGNHVKHRTGGLRKHSRTHSSFAASSLASPPTTSTCAKHVEHPAFELIQQGLIQEYGADAALYKHKKSGAQVLSVIAPDENKVFGATFRTPPDDSTGIPHILEHSVLCGSRKYPVKEPFVDLMKGSLNT